ncbi:unnamed protein product, partial [Amoebophrya sp. A120]|eukprot:GSA120T00021452001.1
MCDCSNSSQLNKHRSSVSCLFELAFPFVIVFVGNWHYFYYYSVVLVESEWCFVLSSYLTSRFLFMGIFLFIQKCSYTNRGCQ